jgi:hypothetical protein
MGMLGKHGVYLVTILDVASMTAIQAGITSTQGPATVADLENFTCAGVDVMIGEARMV